MFTAITLGLFLLITFRLLLRDRRRRSTSHFVDRAVDQNPNGEHGLVLAALAAWTVWESKRRE